ncbi:pirin isoform 2-T3 [Spinachia spinachia]
MTVRKVERTVLSVEQAEGVGAHVRRSIGTKELRNLDPFLMLDEFRVRKPAGFPDHPHRGFETVTYVLQGVMAHQDFGGHSGRLEAGDLQWMTAGQGVVHAEMPLSEEPVVGLQLWVNLASRDKMVEPAYQELKGSEIPKPSQGGVTVSVISGEALGAKSKVYTRTPTLYLDFTLQTGAVHVQPVPSGWTAFIYTLSGAIHAGPDEERQKVEPHHTVVFGNGGCVKVENKEGIPAQRLTSNLPPPFKACRMWGMWGSRSMTSQLQMEVSTRQRKDEPMTLLPLQGADIAHFVLIAGEPIREPVVQQGPFVMTTGEEIRQAVSDFHTARNGFERAQNWRSKIRDSL